MRKIFVFFIPRGLKPEPFKARLPGGLRLRREASRQGWLWSLGHSALRESRALARVGSILFLIILCPAASPQEIAPNVVNVSPEITDENALTLSECYRLALKTSERISIDKERLNEMEGFFIEAFGQFLPHVTFSSKDVTTRYPGSTSGTFERKFVFTQNLFTGFRELAALQGSRMAYDQRVYEKTRAEQLLFVDVSDSFYLYIEQREDLKALETVKGALKKQISELSDRERLGRSRRSEVVSAEALLYQVEAEYELKKSQIVLARQLLEFYVGRPINQLIESENFFNKAKTENYYVSKAELRPDVLAAKKAWEVAKKNTIVAKSDFFPTITAEHGRYLGGHTVADVDTDWDAMLKVSVPIFEGTDTIGAVKVANSQARQAEWEYKRVKRHTAQDIRNTYVAFDASVLVSEALRKALSAAEMNYLLQAKDYTFNLVNNIDVLTAIRDWQQVKRNYITSLYSAKRMYWQLLVASGEPLIY
jgi:outer membrane protein TolC